VAVSGGLTVYHESIDMLICFSSSWYRILRGQCQRICKVHNQLLTGKDCLENGALDITQRAQRDPHQKWVLLPLQENIQLPHENNILYNEIKIVTSNKIMKLQQVGYTWNWRSWVVEVFFKKNSKVHFAWRWFGKSK